MQKKNYQAFAFAAGTESSASSFVCAFDAYRTKALTAIITLMAVLLFGSVFGLPVITILISMIFGVIIPVIVRKKVKPAGRT